MNEIVRVAKEERIIIMCTIHQPSTKVYNGFDEVMILSRARTAFTGNVHDAVPYFERIGYPLPLQTNPAGTLFCISRLAFFVSTTRARKTQFFDQTTELTDSVSLWPLLLQSQK